MEKNLEFIPNKEIDAGEEQHRQGMEEAVEYTAEEKNEEWSVNGAVNKEKSILESLREKSKSLYLAMTFLTAFSFI